MSVPEPKDFFISYTKVDEGWAEWLAWQLEEAGYTTVLQAWDFTPGSNWMLEMHRAASHTKRTLIVLSPEFLEGEYTQQEWAAALAKDATGKQRTLLPVRIKACTLTGLLRTLVYIDLVGLSEDDAKAELRRQLEPRRKPESEPTFPGKQNPDFPGNAPRTSENEEANLWQAYETHLMRAYGTVRVIGTGRGHSWQWPLDRIYVPLELSGGADLYDGAAHSKGRPGRETIPVEAIFRHLQTDKDALVFGDAGSGKTTALQKLLHIVVLDGPEALGLPEDTVPIFLRLAELRDLFDHPEPLRALLEKRLDHPHGRRLDPGTADAVWTHPRRLLLLDGLDELADRKDREAALQIIDAALEATPETRAVVSCRRSARHILNQPPRFRSFDIRPLNDDQRTALSTAWFTEAYRQRQDPDAEAKGQRDATVLMGAYDNVATLDRHLRDLLSTPLFATLLCIIHWLDPKNLPGDSLAFMHRSLTLLLDRRDYDRPVSENAAAKPISSEKLIKILEVIGLRIQTENRQDGLDRDDLNDWMQEILKEENVPRDRDKKKWALWLAKHLKARNTDALEEALVCWLHRDADVLTELGMDILAFAHRGIQEYLTARQLKAKGHEGLQLLAAQVDVTAWREPFLYAMRMLDVEDRATVLKSVVARPEWPMLKPVLQEVFAEHGPNLPSAPFVDALRNGPPQAQRLVLELFQKRGDAALIEAAEKLRNDGPPDIRSLATAFVEDHLRTDETIARPGHAFVEPITGIRFLWVPGGTFMMGADDMSDEEKPIHKVTISPFWLAETPVTNRQYEAFVKASNQEPNYWRDAQYNQPNQPVVGVNWNAATAFCKWLGQQTDLDARLPTEAQWEFAARGAKGLTYPWGNQPPDESLAWFGKTYSKDATKPVGQYPAGAGPFGHLDLAGNVWEWCKDVWNENAYARRSKNGTIDPEENKVKRVLHPVRGGAFVSDPDGLRAAFRSWYLSGF